MTKKIFLLCVAFAIVFAIASCVGTFHADNVDWQFDKMELQEAWLGSLISGIAGLGNSIIGNALQWRKEDQIRQQMYDREDTAVRRRAADLQAAGLSKTLAAGSAAGSATSAPSSLDRGGVTDALSAAMNIQGIKNAKQENANMKTSQLKDMAEIGLMSRNGMRADAEANYFHAMANKAMIDGQVAGYLGLKHLQDIAESKERSKGYKYAAMSNYGNTLYKVQEALNSALDTQLISNTGHRSTVGGNIAGIAKLLESFRGNAAAWFTDSARAQVGGDFEW